jgi:hypothetical protein
VVRLKLPRKKHQEARKLGFRSNFVLAKLGYDLRELYQDVLNEPFPGEIERPLERLCGPGRGVIRFPDDRLRKSGAHSS